MKNDDARYWFIQTALSFQNTLYRWAGDDPSGLDCSGLVVECLKSIGILRSKADATADQLWNQFGPANRVAEPVEGCLAFWFNDSGNATHIAICLDENVCLTADGGGSRTHTREDAIEQNAFIKIRPIYHRRSTPAFVNIFKEE